MIRETLNDICGVVRRICSAANAAAGTVEEVCLTTEGWAKQLREEENLKAKSKRAELEALLSGDKKLLPSDT